MNLYLESLDDDEATFQASGSGWELTVTRTDWEAEGRPTEAYVNFN